MIERFDCDSYVLYKMRMVSPRQFVNYNHLVVDKTSRRAVIFDPAWELATIETLLAQEGATLTHILLTHSHVDHVDLVPALSARHACIVMAGKDEIDYYGLQFARLQSLSHLETIQLGETWITCIFTPGHTRGGCCFLLKKSLITGDTVFNEGCGVCHLDGGSARDMFNSLKLLRANVRGDIRVFPGHSFGTETGMALRDVVDMNIYFHFSDIDKFVAFRSRKTSRSMFEFE